MIVVPVPPPRSSSARNAGAVVDDILDGIFEGNWDVQRSMFSDPTHEGRRSGQRIGSFVSREISTELIQSLRLNRSVATILAWGRYCQWATGWRPVTSVLRIKIR